MTEDLVSAYFGGVAAVPSEQTEAARREARVIVTHVLALLGRMIVLPPEPARAMRRRLHYIDADYLLPYLLDTGFVPRLPTDTKTLIRSYLVDCTHYAIARALPDVGDVLVFLAIFTDALPEVLDAYRNGPPRRHLRFWAALARGYVTKYDDRNRNGKDLHLSFRAMARSDRDRRPGAPPFRCRSCHWQVRRLSAVRARDPQNVILAVVVDDPAGDEEPVRQAVEVLHRLRVHRFHRRQFHHQPLGPARHRPAQVHMCGHRPCRPAG
jgi:hypothetical protein